MKSKLENMSASTAESTAESTPESKSERLKQFLKKTSPNWILLIFAAVALWTYLPAFFPLAGFAAALGTDAEGKYRLFTPARSGCFCVIAAVTAVMFVCTRTANGWDGLSYLIFALCGAALLLCIMIAVLLVRVYYGIHGQKPDPRETFSRGKVWMIADAAAVIAVAASWIYAAS